VTTAPPAARPHPVRARFGRRKFDKQPEQPAAVLIASNGVKIPGAALRLAQRVGGGKPVAVVSIARLYGSSFGLQNRGLMPTAQELAEQREIVGRAVTSIEKGGAESWGQVAITRRPAKTIATAARARGVGHVIVVRSEQAARWRRVVEGDLAKEVARKLGPGVEVEGVSP
jgi:alkylated DNA nucleotide flippase Atl1